MANHTDMTEGRRWATRLPNPKHGSHCSKLASPMWWKFGELTTMAPKFSFLFKDVAPPHVLCLFFAVPCAPLNFIKASLLVGPPQNPLNKKKIHKHIHPPTHRWFVGCVFSVFCFWFELERGLSCWLIT